MQRTAQALGTLRGSTRHWHRRNTLLILPLQLHKSRLHDDYRKESQNLNAQINPNLKLLATRGARTYMQGESYVKASVSGHEHGS